MLRTRHPQDDPEPSPPGDPAHYHDALGRLARILDGIPWLLAGGLAIPLTIGAFYRSHRDVDIVFPLRLLGDVDDAMRRAGYRLTTRVRFHLGSRRMEAMLPMRGRGLMIRLRRRRLRFTIRRPPHPFLRYVDVMPWVDGDGWVEACNSALRVPRIEPMKGRTVSLPCGASVACLNLDYARAFMRTPDSHVHRLDRSYIAEALDARTAAASA